MKINIKQLFLYSLVGLGGAGMTSCNDFLNREPITSVTPNSYLRWPIRLVPMSSITTTLLW